MTYTVVTKDGVVEGESNCISIEEREFHMNWEDKDYAGRVFVNTALEGMLGPMANGHSLIIDGKEYLVLDRYEDQETYNILSR